MDDDGDGIIDFPFEPGCSAAGDADEDDGARAVGGNGQDDDGDGYADYPEDPGCVGVGDMDETDSTISPACSDQIDNDRDGSMTIPKTPDVAAEQTEMNRRFVPQERPLLRLERIKSSGRFGDWNFHPPGLMVVEVPRS